MSSDRDELQQDVRFRILRLLDANPRISQRELSRQLGISLGAVNYCVKAFVEKGQLKIHNFRASNRKIRYAYVLTPKGVAQKTALANRFLHRKLKEYEALKAEIENLQKDMEREAQTGTSSHSSRN